MLNIAILGSGNGSILPALFTEIKLQHLPINIKLIISNKKNALILKRAEEFNIPRALVMHANKDRQTHEKLLVGLLEQQNINLILLIGYMRILSPYFINKWKNKIFNVHPSLLPEFSGLMDLAVHQAVINAKKDKTGCTVHIVDRSLDGGKIVIQKYCSVEKNDTPLALKKRVQSLEHLALIEAIKKISCLGSVITNSL